MKREEAKEAIKEAYGNSEYTDEIIKALEQEPTTNNDLALINTWGLDEEIRCTMCTNSMKSDRGCDGSCVVNNDMYKAVMDAIEKRIQSTTNNDLGVECVSRQAVEALVWEYLKKGTDENIAIYEHFLDLPTVTPIRPKGHWIVEKGGSYLEKRNACCSNCKDFYSNDWNVFNYCPNCGADMREGVEE